MHIWFSFHSLLHFHQLDLSQKLFGSSNQTRAAFSETRGAGGQMRPSLRGRCWLVAGERFLWFHSERTHAWPEKASEVTRIRRLFMQVEMLTETKGRNQKGSRFPPFPHNSGNISSFNGDEGPFLAAETPHSRIIKAICVGKIVHHRWRLLDFTWHYSAWSSFLPSIICLCPYASLLRQDPIWADSITYLYISAAFLFSASGLVLIVEAVLF